MASSTEDYGSELQDLQWGLRDGGGGSAQYLRSAGGSSQYLRGGGGPGGSYEAEDLEPSSSRLRHHQQHGSASGRDRGYYSPPGTSYTIVERPPSAPHHHSTHTTPYRHRGHGHGHGHGQATTSMTALGSGGPISPEQVIRLVALPLITFGLIVTAVCLMNKVEIIYFHIKT